MIGRQVSHLALKTYSVFQRMQPLRSRRSLILSAQSAKTSMPDHVVICGGGIIGVATAYYLTLQGIKPLLVEKTGIACAASGKAGGFLALDWTDELARTSYSLHRELAMTLDADIGYRPVQSLALSATALKRGSSRQRSAKLPDWLDGSVSGGQVLGNVQTTAQVHPEKLTKAMMAAAEMRGAQVRSGTVESISSSEGPAAKVTGVIVDGELIQADAVVLALGPWTNTLASSLQLPHISGQLGHSLVLKPSTSEALPADCLFVSWQSKSGKVSEPEIFVRADGTVWCCGENKMVNPPEDPLQVKPCSGASAAIQEVAKELSSHLDSAEVVQQQACIRPLSPDGSPVIGQHPYVAGAYIATGHSCWGILNGPATGKALAEMIATGASQCVDLTPYDPARLIRKTDGVRRKERLIECERTHLADREPIGWDSHL
ncbi:TPA: hypothetical protein ACH3X1_011646 [Trebouxia sp. C0004]